MDYLALIGTVTLIHLLAVISPGPDFVMAVRNAVTYSRRTGLWTAVGFGLGIAVHIGYALAGLAVIISQSILLFNAIKLLGAGYLVYIGIKSLLAKSSVISVTSQVAAPSDLSPLAAVKSGFLTNVLNPKATLFILSLFTLVIAPDTPLAVMAIMSGIMVVNTIIWFGLVAVFLSQQSIRQLFERFQGVFNKTLGGILIALGVKVALTQR